jgi:hypothetical protein
LQAVRALRELHGLFGGYGILPGDHLDKSMALVSVDDAGLDLAVLAEDVAELLLGASELWLASGGSLGNRK